MYALHRDLQKVARNSLWRNLSKWGAGGPITKPVALMTAFIEQPRDVQGHTPTDLFHKGTLNRARNDSLKRDLAQVGLSFYPVIGAGQSQRKFLGFSYISPTEEESFVVQPRGAMEEQDFLDAIRQLLIKYEQYAAAVKIPSDPMAFLLPQYGERIPLGTSVEIRHPGEPYFTALKKGPRADDGMLDSWELSGEHNLLRRFINLCRGRSDLNRAKQDRGGRRFIIKNPEPFPKGGEPHVQDL